MVRITPCISVVIQRKAVKNQQLLEKWISENSLISYDENLVCMTIAMNPYDVKDMIESLNKRLGIQIYDESNPYEPVAKDGLVVERFFGSGARCNWVKRDKSGNYLSFIPENERKPAYVPEKYDPSMDKDVKDLGEYNGKHIILRENRYEMYLMHGEDRHHVPIHEHGEIPSSVFHEMSLQDAILCIEDVDSFYEMMNKRLEEAFSPLIVDFGLHEGAKLEIRGSRHANKIVHGDKFFLLPKEYQFNAELCKTLDTAKVLEFIEEDIAKREERKQYWKAKREEQERLRMESAIVKDLGDTSEGHLYVWKGKYGNFIKLIKDDEQKNYRLPKEFQKDDALCKKLNAEEVLAMIQI